MRHPGRHTLLSHVLPLVVASALNACVQADGVNDAADSDSAIEADGAASAGDSGESDSGAEDAGSEDAGSEDAGSEDTGSEDTGSEDTGSEDTGSEDTGSEDTGSEDTGSEDTGSEDTGSEDTGSEDAGREDVDGEDAGREDADGEDASTGDAAPDVPEPECGDASDCPSAPCESASCMDGMCVSDSAAMGTACEVGRCDGESVCVAMAPPSLDSLDWLSQDFVPAAPSADPYCMPTGRAEAHISTELGYLRTDAAQDEGGISALAPTYNPERQRWEMRVLTTFDFRPYAESQPGVGGIPNGADVFEGEGQYVSIVGTNDSGGVAGWASSWGDGCQFFDGWISYDRFNVPTFRADDRGTWASVSSPITGVPSPMRDNCPEGFGSTVTRWTYVPEFTFASESTCPGDTGRKVMNTIVSDHDGGNHHEVFYFTDEYGGKSRWERWECGIPYPDHDFITDRCQYNEAQSVMHMAYGVNEDRRTIVNPNGDTCYMTDCRDFTRVEPIAEPGYRAAAWHYGAAIYFSGNILRNGDFNRGDDSGWEALGTTALVATDASGNHFLRVSASETGWHSVFGNSIDEFNRFFDGDGAEAFRPKYLHWGARVRHSVGGGSARLALIEWGNPDGEIIHESGLELTPDWQWVEFHSLMGPATNSLDLRIRLDALSALEVDDVYVYISEDPER